MRNKKWKVPPWQEHLPSFCRSSVLKTWSSLRQSEATCVSRSCYLRFRLPAFFLVALFFFLLAISVTSFP